MLSVFSDAATSEIKSHYAFRIFGKDLGPGGICSSRGRHRDELCSRSSLHKEGPRRNFCSVQAGPCSPAPREPRASKGWSP